MAPGARDADAVAHWRAQRRATIDLYLDVASAALMMPAVPFADVWDMARDGLGDVGCLRARRPQNPWRGAWLLVATPPALLVVAPLYAVLATGVGIGYLLVGATGATATAAFRRPPRPRSEASARFGRLCRHATRLAARDRGTPATAPTSGALDTNAEAAVRAPAAVGRQGSTSPA